MIADPEPIKQAISPVRRIPTDPTVDAPQPGIGLCLSGGGYRAMLFHLGTLSHPKNLLLVLKWSGEISKIRKENSRSKGRSIRDNIITYLKTHPSADLGELRRAGLEKKLRSIFEGSVNDARRAAGLTEERYLSKEDRMKRIVTYLKSHPAATPS